MLALLSGRVSQEKFSTQDDGLIPGQWHKDAINLFEQNLREGRLIENIRIEKLKDEDDDTIIIDSEILILQLLPSLCLESRLGLLRGTFHVYCQLKGAFVQNVLDKGDGAGETGELGLLIMGV